LFYATGDFVKILIDGGADMNIRDKEGLTALHYSARRNNIEKVKALLEGGAEIDDDINNLRIISGWKITFILSSL
jgi:ankyrin repeat protein